MMRICSKKSLDYPVSAAGEVPDHAGPNKVCHDKNQMPEIVYQQDVTEYLISGSISHQCL